MMKKSHILIGVTANLAAHGWGSLPVLVMGVGGAVFGSMLPDFDLKLGIKHRTVTHWLIWPVLLFFLVPWLPARAAALGWFLHIVADCLTVEGLAPFWPLRFRIRGFIKTGGALESVMLGCAFLLVGFFFLRGNNAFQTLLSHLGNLVY